VSLSKTTYLRRRRDVLGGVETASRFTGPCIPVVLDERRKPFAVTGHGLHDQAFSEEDHEDNKTGR